MRVQLTSSGNDFPFKWCSDPWLLLLPQCMWMLPTLYFPSKPNPCTSISSSSSTSTKERWKRKFMHNTALCEISIGSQFSKNLKILLCPSLTTFHSLLFPLVSSTNSPKLVFNSGAYSVFSSSMPIGLCLVVLAQNSGERASQISGPVTI